MFIERKEVSGIASVLGISPGRFMREYSDSYHCSLRLKGDYKEPCIFLEKNRCLIYEERPSQCRTFPFWGEICKYPEKVKELISYCRGVSVKGGINE